MRIVAGQHRGRVLQSPESDAVRPTSDRARESLFNILEHGKLATGGLSPVRGARVLDCFCGTGALGLARANARTLGELTRAQFITADATRPPRADQPCALVFLDPPYGKGLAGPALLALANAGWFGPAAIAVVETAHHEDVRAPEGFAAMDERRYGKAKLTFLRRA